MKKILIAATATIGLVATPALAQAERVGAPIEASEQLEGENGVLIAILAAAAVIAGLIILLEDDTDEPASP